MFGHQRRQSHYCTTERVTERNGDKGYGPQGSHLSYKQKKQPPTKVDGCFFGPSDRSRTCGLLNPIQARYQSALHPDLNIGIIAHYNRKIKG